MRRRRLVLLVSAITLGILGIITVSLVLFVTRTDAGRGRLRAILQPYLASKVQGGSLYIGKLGGNFLTEFTVDSFAIRDKSGELFASTGPISFTIDPRDLVDNRIFIRRARIEHPYMHLVQHEDNEWNYKRIFASKDQGPPKPRDPKRRALLDYIVIDSTAIKNGTFLLTMAWHPDDSLKGAARDSSIRAHLENPQKAVTRRSDGFGRTYAWTNAHGLLRHARLADPDSDQFGRRFVIDTLSTDEIEPTFKFRSVSADVRNQGDTIRFTIPHFDMPASTGSGSGKVWWGSGRPMRYDIAIHGDSVSLDDVNWVYPTLPRTGGGTLDLLIKNDPKNDRIIDFHLRKMDVRSTKSHLTGNMSFGIGAPVLLVRNVDLRADPVDFDLIRTLAGKPFPLDWRGQLYGTVVARGGPLTNFYIDDVRGTFRDAHVPGAVSEFAGRGELDILYPAYTAFHHFDVDAKAIDLRTIEFLNPNFPRIRGIISGTATLDSSYLDVRFSDASITHTDGPGEPSHFTGSGRVTYGDLMTFDLTLDAQPLSLTMLARSYPKLTLRGLVSGPVRVKGQAPDLEVSTSLQGVHGALSFDGRLDLDSLGGYGARGRGSFSNVDVGGLIASASVPAGKLSGRYETEVSGETPATLRGHADIDVDTTRFDSIRVYRTRARVAFENGRAKLVDSLRLQTQAGTFVARGGFGLPGGKPDSLVFSAVVDSLGGLRRYLATKDSTHLAATGLAIVDSLSGTAEVKNGVIYGTSDSFTLSATLTGKEIYINKDLANSLVVGLELRDLPSATKGIVEVRFDSVTLAGLAIDTIGGRLVLADPTHGRFTAGILFKNSPAAAASGTWDRRGETHIVTADSLGLVVGDARWRLERPTRFALDSAGSWRLDSLVLRNRDSAVVALAADVPKLGPALARLRASRVPLNDVAMLAQLADTVRGFANADVSVTGTRLDPQIVASADLSSVLWRAVEIDRVSTTADYRARRVNLRGDVIRRGQTAISARANLPATVTLLSVRQRDDSVSGSLQADSTDLELVKAFLPQLRESDLKGRLSARLNVLGTWRAPVVEGTVSIADGQANIPQLGVTLASITGSVVGTRSAGGQDSLSIRLSAFSEGKPTGNIRLGGYVKNLLQQKNDQEFALSLGASAFHALSKRSQADLYITTTDSIRLRGTTQFPRMTGALRVDRGSIYLADREIARKQAVEIAADSLAREAATPTSAMFSKLMTNLQVSGVTITLGEDVRLRSAEANVRLTDSLRLLTSTNRARRTATVGGSLIPTFDIEGTLRTAGGSYNLNLGLVQRDFTVLPEGTVTFDGDPKNPLLDIKAQHNVRRPGDRDLGVIVNLHGRLLPYPVIDFSSNAEYTIGQSDLISYLLIGRAGFDYGDKSAQVLASFLAPTLSAFAADRLRQTPLGSWVDAFQFQLGTSSDNGGATTTNGGSGLRDYLYSSTVSAEKQFKNIFVSLNSGFCSLQTGQAFDPRNALGAKAELRVAPELSLKLSYDPPTASRICGQQSIIGLVPTPYQFGLSLAHVWRF